MLSIYLLLLLSSGVAGSVMGEECDWIGSGLSTTSEGRGVTPVYLRCSQGVVEWSYPRGALRVLLRLGASGREFRGCVKVGPDFGGARIYLEGPRSLSPLFLAEDGEPKRMARCFHSRGGQAALYVEATEPSADFRKNIASLTYDLEALPRGGRAFDPSEECRPCTKEEMAHVFCTSDLVTRGTIRGIEHDEDLQVSQVTIQVTQMLRQTTPSSQDGVAVLAVPGHCGARHGSGEFVFMARRKLGDLALTCAPRLEDWVSVVRDLNRDGSAHCVLKV